MTVFLHKKNERKNNNEMFQLKQILTNISAPEANQLLNNESRLLRRQRLHFTSSPCPFTQN